ncbi:MAG TPA: hypothetical protein VFO39_22325 [Candidatus Sulfotelmatobacter sp.]|nr:hypothetical protein [Candidatus Sulfotelmatobacter sp.]
MATVLGIVVRVAIGVALAFILSISLPRMPNKMCRFVFLFALCLPVNFGVNYVNVQLLGYHKMGWTGASIIALLLAIWGTFLYSPQPQNSNTP